MADRGTLTDASALIYLAKADYLALADACLGKLEIPPSVWREAAESRLDRHLEEIARMRLAERAGTLRRVTLTESIRRRAGELASQHRLGAGESEVLALGTRGAQVLLDEARALRVAEELGLAPMRTIRIPLLAARQGRLSRDAAIEALHHLAVVSNARIDTVERLERTLRKGLR